MHVAIDDYSRLAFAEVLANETAATAIGFLKRARAFFARYGIHVERILTDNGSACRATVHALACKTLGIQHRRTRPYRPQTNGKAERFIRTLLNGWAYGAIYGSSQERTHVLDGWLWHYNHRRRLSPQPPSPDQQNQPAWVLQPTGGKIDRAGAQARGRDALKGIKTQPGKDRDEYPPKVLDTGGTGASVRHINPSANRSAVRQSDSS